MWNRQRRTSSQINVEMRATAQTPPTTPPAIAPASEELCVASDVAVSVELAVGEAVVVGAVVVGAVVDVDSVDCVYLISAMEVHMMQ